MLFKVALLGTDDTTAAILESCISSKISRLKIEIERGAEMPILTESPSILVIDISISSPILIPWSVQSQQMLTRLVYLHATT